MTEFKTRKGLAIGAAAALAVSGFVSTPANAAETLTLAPTSGDLYTSVTTSDFVLAAGFAGTESSAATATLKYRVVNASETSLTAAVVSDGSAATESIAPYAGSTGTASTTSEDDFVVFGGTPAIGDANTLSLVPGAHTADVTVTVQAFLDLDGDNAIDSNEATSPVRTVTFYDQANMGLGELTYESITLGSNSVTVSFTTNPALNYSQIDSGDFDVQGLVAGTDSSTAASVIYSSTFKDLRATVTLGEVVSATKSVGMQVELTNGTSNADLGTPVYNVVEAGKATGISAVTTKNGTSVYDSNKLRAGSGTVTVEATVTVGATDSKVQPVTFVFEEDAANSLNSGATLTAGGETLSNTSSSTSQKISVTVNSVEKTETTGVATLTFSYAGLKDGDDIDVRASANGPTAIVTSADLALVGDDSVVTALVDNVDGAARVVKGSSMSIGYTVVDQFGQTPAAAEGEFRIVVTEDSSDANFTQTISVVNGSATFTTTENSTANNNYTVTGTLQEKPVGASSFSGISGGITEETTVAAVSADSASAISVTAANNGSSSAVALSLFDQASGDDEKLQGSVAFSSYAGTALTGTVTNSNGAPLAGAPVTLSAIGLQFVFDKADSGKVYGADSITVNAATDGTYSVLVSSHKSGSQTITATSGSATKTEVVKFAEAGPTTATTWTFDAPTTAEPGSTFKVTATLTDKYGNAVSVDPVATSDDVPNILTSYSGPGIVFGDLPSGTNASGQFSFSVLLGANDTGSATITAGYSLNADADTADYGDFAASTTVTVGTGTFTGTYGTMSAWTVDQGDGTAKVYVKFPTIGEKVRIGHQTGGSGSYETIYVKTTTSENMDGLRQVAGVGTYVVRTIDLVDGTNRIRVTVGDSTEVQVRYNE